MKSKPEVNRINLLHRVRGILDAHTEDPAEQMIREGEALAAIGKALLGIPVHEARAVLRAVTVMEGAA
jgi:hypothetical protein